MKKTHLIKKFHKELGVVRQNFNALLDSIEQRMGGFFTEEPVNKPIATKKAAKVGNKNTVLRAGAVAGGKVTKKKAKAAPKKVPAKRSTAEKIAPAI